jgi:WS/DGAT/MGAT family acyltransferase
MRYVHHERLSALDTSFLDLEDANTHMHIGSVALFDAAPLARADGGVDIERFRALIEASIHRIPRYRQRLAWIPIVKQPVWVDDARFNLHYHLRHAQLPHPGDERSLKRFAGHVMSQQLDRGKPLWEMWVVEGIEGGRFALILKAHHCMIDGVGSAELMASIMRPTADEEPRLDRPPPRWIPRPAPQPFELLLRDVARHGRDPVLLAGALRQALARPRAAVTGLYEAARSVAEAVGVGLHPASPTPFNVDIGPHRRFDWTDIDLEAVRAIKGRHQATVNDVVLAVLTGALRRFFRHRGIAVEALDFRAMLPVNVRGTGDGALGNRVTMMVARLPLDERDPEHRLARVATETRELKASRQAAGVKVIEELGDWTFNGLFVQFARLTAQMRPFNVVVTNVPGPQFPIYVLGARMTACYPLVPLYRNQALGVALFSYDHRLYWGFNADWDALPDLHDLVVGVQEEFALLAGASRSAA